MPSISPFGPSATRSTSAGTGSEVKDDFALRADLSRRIGPDRTFRQERLGRGAAQIIDDKLMPGLLQIGRHALTHHAQADKSYAHLPLRRPHNR